MNGRKSQLFNGIFTDRVELLPQTPYLLNLMTHLRDQNTKGAEYVRTVDRIARQLIPQALNRVPTQKLTITTPTGSDYSGIEYSRSVCGISVLRAGASLEQPLRECWGGPLSFGKILIQRDENTCLPVHLYSKYPAGVEESVVLLLEPILATGGSACKAIELILERGVSEENIIFVNVIASQEGVHVVTQRFPNISIVTAAIDQDMNEHKHVIPGLGDFGDRFYATDC